MAAWCTSDMAQEISSDGDTFSKIPLIGLGTFQLYKEDTANLRPLILSSLKLGYRLFDLAECYKNSKEICQVLSDCLQELKIPRSEIFITSKIQPKDQGLEKAKTACEKILSDCTITTHDYIDLCLIHWPGTQKVKPTDIKNFTNRIETWKVMIEFYKAGQFKNIGVSNFTKTHLEEIVRFDSKIHPALVQNENHPFYSDKEALKYCQQNGIAYQSYSPFGQGKVVKFLKSSEDEDVKRLLIKLEDLNLTIFEMLLLYNLQQGILVIPKTSKSERLEGNFRLCAKELPDDLLQYLEKVKDKFENVIGKTAWDPLKIR